MMKLSKIFLALCLSLNLCLPNVLSIQHDSNQMRAAEENTLLGFGVEARYNTNRIYWDSVDGVVGYKVLRSETVDGEFTTLFSDAITATEYIDTTAGVNTQYFYKLEVITSSETITSNVVQDKYATGYVALHEHAKNQLHKNYLTNMTFNGDRVEVMTTDETSRVATLNKGTVLLVFNPSGESTGQRQIIWGIKNGSTTTQTANASNQNNPANNVSYFLFNQLSARYDYGYALRSGVGSNLTANAWTGWGVSNTTFTSGNNVVHSLNGSSANGYGGANWDNFLSKLSGLDQMYIGGSVNGSTNVAMFKGKIAFVTVTDEVLSADEMNAYTNELKTLLTARESLQLDYSTLIEAINAAKVIYEAGNDDVYTSDSWNAFVNAYTAAQTTMESLTTTQNDIESASTLLNGAVSGLVSLEREIILNEAVEARYSSNRVYWDSISGAIEYKVYRSESMDGSFTQIGSTTTTEYVDENAETGKMYYYQIEVVFVDNVHRSETVSDTFVPGIEAVQEHAKAQLHKDYTENSVFDGTRVEILTVEETARVAALKEATVLLAFKPDGSATSTQRQIIWNIKNSSTNTATTNATDGNPANNISYLTYTSGSVIKVRYDHGYGLKADMAQNATADAWNVFAVAHDTFTTGNNILHSVNGITTNGFGSANWNGFVSKMNGLDKMYVGGSLNGDTKVATYYGKIAYVTITDEIMSQTEMNEYTTALQQKLTEMDTTSVDKSELEEAIQNATSILPNNYTDASYALLTNAMQQANTVMENQDATEEDVNNAVKAINDAIAALEYKGADYSAVNVAIEAANALDANLYTNFDAVTEAINAVVEGKDITKQAEVDAMAKAINDAVAALTYKGADYTAVNAAIEAANALDANLYTNFDTVTAAINAVVRDLDITKQTEVDAMAKAINDAIATLEDKGLATVQNLVITQDNYKTVTLTWDINNKATSYDVYRKAFNVDSDYVLITTVSDPTATISGLMTGKEYTFYVVAKNETEVSKASETVSFTTQLEGEVTLTLTANGNNKFDLSWNKVDGATRYIIYRKSETSAWKKVLTLGKDVTTYTTKAMVEGTYTYQVKAARYDGVDRVFAKASNEVSGVGTLNGITLTTQQVDENQFTLTWNKLHGMQGYDVYRSTEENGKYVHLKRTSSTQVDVNVKDGKTYTYKVRGYRLIDNVKVYSLYSNVVMITVN